MTLTWKIFSLTPDYPPRLDHNKIISNHHAATCELSTRSIGKFTEKLISCQGHFHCELSTRGIGKFTEKLISCQGHFQYRGRLTFNHSKRTFTYHFASMLWFQPPQQSLGHGQKNYMSPHGHTYFDYCFPPASGKPGPGNCHPCGRQREDPREI